MAKIGMAEGAAKPPATSSRGNAEEIQHPSNPGVQLLSRRQREIAELVTRGMTNSEIADVLALSRRTVDNQLANIFKKLAINGRVQLTYLMTAAAAIAGSSASPGFADERQFSEAGLADEDRHSRRYFDYKILPDDPAVSPGLGFINHARALAELIAQSRPGFAIGIFGGWGSGKTTLMRSISRILSDDANMIPVWLNSWRYEPEPNPVIPLLSLVAEALEERSRKGRGERWAHDSSLEFGQAAQAFTVSQKASADRQMSEAARSSAAEAVGVLGTSDEGPGYPILLDAGLRRLRNAIRRVSAHGIRRLVVFIDDLDRCSSTYLLEVLKMMQLLLDVDGFVLVAALDKAAVEQALAAKFAAEGETEARTSLSASNLVRRTFQVQFAVPVVGADQLSRFLDVIVEEGDFSPAQRQDFDENLRRHFAWIQGRDRLNVREVKRLVNSYTVQLKVLSPLLGDELDPDVVLTLLMLSYRPAWREIYLQLSADPELFQAALRDILRESDRPTSLGLSGDILALPPEFVEYMRGPGSALVNTTSLSRYIAAAESTLPH